MDLDTRIKRVHDRAFDYESTIKVLNRDQSDVDKLRELLYEYVPIFITDKHLLFFLGSEFTPEEAFDKMKLMFEIKCNLPEAFSNRDPFSKEITTVYENINILYMPISPSGHSVIYLSLRNYSVRSFNFEAATKAFFMTLEACLFNQGPQKGIIFLVDMRGGTLFHVSKLNFHIVRMALRLAHNPPLKIHEIHFFNCLSLIHLLLQLVRPFARKEIKELLRLHSGDINWSDFYDTPVDSIDEMNRRNLLELQKLNDYFQVDHEQVMEYKNKLNSQI